MSEVQGLTDFWRFFHGDCLPVPEHLHTSGKAPSHREVTFEPLLGAAIAHGYTQVIHHEVLGVPSYEHLVLTPFTATEIR